ncbi:hypothetical protein BDN70DRAFT_620078 [Pholiota conissans]|uniref:Uncharacterized protein n=1 Tax=Pholiota conissans TaxID=109636 RepID=A0A9P5Z6L7_9AGAR|nr:hypothetical protein BDN70DRAFT_620078 [Pholiota conissans]
MFGGGVLVCSSAKGGGWLVERQLRGGCLFYFGLIVFFRSLFPFSLSCSFLSPALFSLCFFFASSCCITAVLYNIHDTTHDLNHNHGRVSLSPPFSNILCCSSYSSIQSLLHQ